MLENATRICQAQFGMLNFYDGSAFRNVALHNSPPQFAKRLGEIIRPHPDSGLAQVARTRQIAHIEDLRTGQPYLDGDKAVVDVADLGGARTVLIVPMLSEGKLIGAISIYRPEVRPFTDKQIALVQNFAAQAVIAIENTRLLNELRQSLERQTATADVLRVISSSPGDLAPVFEAMLANAVRICGAKSGNLALVDSGKMRIAAMHGAPPALEELRRREAFVDPTSPLMRIMETKAMLSIADLAAEPRYADAAISKVAGGRTFLGVPMFKDKELVGAISIYRQQVQPFSDKQIALMQSFAAQAVIAIENTRLLSELRQSLEQQTATADVLRVISSSPGELKPVFETALENATRLCEASFGVLVLHEGDAFRVSAMHNVPPAFGELRQRDPTFRPGPLNPVSRAAATKQLVHIANLADDIAYKERDPAAVLFVELAGTRTLLVVPMLKEAELVGAIAIYRQEARPFSDKQIGLVQNFAAQAVIAIENARLLNELRQRTDDLSKSLEDLRAAQDRLVQTEKLASLGQLTAGIAHEIKNPLNFVNNFSSLSVELIDELEEKVSKVKVDDAARGAITDLAETLKGNLEKVAQHGKRADAIVKNMLLHSREGWAASAGQC